MDSGPPRRHTAHCQHFGQRHMVTSSKPNPSNISSDTDNNTLKVLKFHRQIFFIFITLTKYFFVLIQVAKRYKTFLKSLSSSPDFSCLTCPISPKEFIAKNSSIHLDLATHGRIVIFILTGVKIMGIVPICMGLESQPFY